MITPANELVMSKWQLIHIIRNVLFSICQAIIRLISSYVLTKTVLLPGQIVSCVALVCSLSSGYKYRGGKALYTHLPSICRRCNQSSVWN